LTSCLIEHAASSMASSSTARRRIIRSSVGTRR
jgi:hypothetical protein